MPKVFAAAKAVIVNTKGEILMLHSSAVDGEGNAWDFPGGRLEAGEEVLEAVIRETQEEAGITLDPTKAQLLTSDVFTGFGKTAGDAVMKTFYVFEGINAEPTLSWEHDDYMWFAPHKGYPNDFGRLPRTVLDAYKAKYKVQVADERIKGRQGYGLIQLIHGHGKGKSTSALGMAVRCAGSGRNVAIIYFDKGGTDHYFERNTVDTIENIDYWATGRDRIDPETGRFDFSIQDIDKNEAERGIQLAKDAMTSGKYALVILDEINSTVDLGMLSKEAVLQALQDKRDDVEVILTGRDPDPALLEAAHLISQVTLQKHYFYSGVQAREGLDF